MDLVVLNLGQVMRKTLELESSFSKLPHPSNETYRPDRFNVYLPLYVRGCSVAHGLKLLTHQPRFRDYDHSVTTTTQHVHKDFPEVINSIIVVKIPKPTDISLNIVANRKTICVVVVNATCLTYSDRGPRNSSWVEPRGFPQNSVVSRRLGSCLFCSEKQAWAQASHLSSPAPNRTRGLAARRLLRVPHAPKALYKYKHPCFSGIRAQALRHSQHR
ncbi:hypothetical protein TNCV_380941 [Trichonephila clavipes]|uniref:Uncharacterized protein n=1 Tax=Trichonephila clavipes TaxID=2585209 RepID=A0A8X6S9Y5_TRICX|nr:hypothetical protein TNCV_380941 [Trichonephila clavipes]